MQTKQQFSKVLISAVVLSLAALLAVTDARASDAVDLRDVHTLTFRRGKTTAGRRSAGVPQLLCNGGDACSSSHLVDVVMCQNAGEDDYGEVQWKCESDLDESIRLGQITVTCEGYTSRTDKLKLRGSCGLEYSLHYTQSSHNRRAAHDSYEQSSYVGGRSYHGHNHRSRAVAGDGGSWVSTLLLVGMVGLLVMVCVREQNARNTSPPHSNGTGAGNPPPYNPSAPPGGSTPYPGSSYGYGSYGGGLGGLGGNGAGFWTGATLGGIAGSLLGGNRGGYYGNNGGWGGWGNGWGNGYRTRPMYTSSGYTSTGSGYSTRNTFSGGGSSTGTTRRSTGYGGTSTR